MPSGFGAVVVPADQVSFALRVRVAVAVPDRAGVLLRAAVVIDAVAKLLSYIKQFIVTM